MFLIEIDLFLLSSIYLWFSSKNRLFALELRRLEVGATKLKTELSNIYNWLKLFSMFEAEAYVLTLSLLEL